MQTEDCAASFAEERFDQLAVFVELRSAATWTQLLFAVHDFVRLHKSGTSREYTYSCTCVFVERYRQRREQPALFTRLDSSEQQRWLASEQ